jgi:hypothetical protein
LLTLAQTPDRQPSVRCPAVLLFDFLNTTCTPQHHDAALNQQGRRQPSSMPHHHSHHPRPRWQTPVALERSPLLLHRCWWSVLSRVRVPHNSRTTRARRSSSYLSLSSTTAVSPRSGGPWWLPSPQWALAVASISSVRARPRTLSPSSPPLVLLHVRALLSLWRGVGNPVGV